MKTWRRSLIVTAMAASFSLLIAFAVGAQPQIGSSPPRTGTEDPSALLLGIVRLQGTTDAVSLQQAAQLLALVQAWRMQMVQPPAIPAGSQPGQGPAQQPSPETSLLDGIRAVLTPTQWQAIVVMNLSANDVMQWMGLPASGDPPPPPGVGSQAQPPANPPAGNPLGAPPPPGGAQQETPRVQFADAVIALLTSWIVGS
ncbi:MAG: hypothetical protein ABFD77_11010 [Thermotogota bacterium]